MAYLIWSCVCLLLALSVVHFWASGKKSITQQSIILFVGGDFGRSPRMMYHAASIKDHQVHVIAHFESDILPELRGKIKQHALCTVKRGSLYFFRKIFFQSCHLWLLLLRIPPSTILMQVHYYSSSDRTHLAFLQWPSYCFGHASQRLNW